MQLPSTKPRDDPVNLWALQLELLERAKSILGPHDPSKKICQPKFVDKSNSTIGNPPTFNPTWVELTRKAECNWKKVVTEMAHETVHLLNPVLKKDGKTLEEGMAVKFSLCVQDFYSINDILDPVQDKPYWNALDLVKELPDDPLDSGRQIREEVGARISERVGGLSAATLQDLKKLFPKVNRTVLSDLGQVFRVIERSAHARRDTRAITFGMLLAAELTRGRETLKVSIVKFSKP